MNKFSIESVNHNNISRLDAAIQRATFVVSEPLILPNQPLILVCVLPGDEDFFINLAYWPSSVLIGKRVASRLESMDSGCPRLCSNLLSIATLENSQEEQCKLLREFQLNTMSELGLVMMINDGDPVQEEEFQKHPSLPEVSLNHLSPHLYYIMCYLQ